MRKGSAMGTPGVRTWGGLRFGGRGLGIRAKLFGGFGVVLALLAVVGFIGWKNNADFSHDFKTLYNDRLTPLVQLSDVQQGLYELRVGAFGYASADDFTRKKYQANEVQWFRQIDDNMAAYRAHALSAQEQEVLTEWDGVYGKYVESARKVAALEKDGNFTAAQIYRTSEGGRLLTQAIEIVGRLTETQRAIGAEMNTSVASRAAGSQRLLVGAIAVALLVGLGMSLFISRGVALSVAAVGAAARRIAREDLPSLVRVARAMAAGDLTQHATVTAQRVRVTSKDEIGAMAASFNEMIDGLQDTGAAFSEMGGNLREIVGQVRGSADLLAEASGRLDEATGQAGAAVGQVTQSIQHMATGAQETSGAAQTGNHAVEQLSRVIDGIARGAEVQAQRVQAASDTATGMATGVQQVADSAGAVASASEQAKATAERGVEAVRGAVAGMTEIKDVVARAATKVEELGKLGEQIGAVVETIDDIAEQTNLLALNAAIEAARAGEHGKGFAVVADEVRKLAERSQRETKAIAGLIAAVRNGTQEAVQAMESGSLKVAAGATQAENSGAAFTEILAAVETTVERATGIAAAAREMASGARGLMGTMEEMGAAVSANAGATTEMVAQASHVTSAIQAIAAVAEEQSASTEEVSASAEEMTAQVEQMGAQAQDLAATAEQLRSLVARFHLDANVQMEYAERDPVTLLRAA